MKEKKIFDKSYHRKYYHYIRKQRKSSNNISYSARYNLNEIEQHLEDYFDRLLLDEFDSINFNDSDLGIIFYEPKDDSDYLYSFEDL